MAATMRCHYEVLEVERNAAAAEIRTQYYKLARIWHPDKNPQNLEEANLRFKELQQAYEVLSDIQERAWYDSHREQILRGYHGDEADAEEFQGINLWPYFSRACFKGFGADKEGFYTVYHSVFETIAQEEVKFGPDSQRDTDFYPNFGNADSQIKEVRQFYQYWNNFASRKTFAWRDKYKTSDAPNRQIRRIAEKENKKERDKAKREFNDLVRRLVAHVRRQDPRVLLDEQRVAREKRENEEKTQIAKQQKQQALAEAREKARAEESVLLDELNLEELGISESESDEEKDNFFCVACKKVFRNERQWENHERSKKHKQAVEKIKEEVSLLSDFDGEPIDHTDITQQVESNNKEKDGEEQDSLKGRHEQPPMKSDIESPTSSSQDDSNQDEDAVLAKMIQAQHKHKHKEKGLVSKPEFETPPPHNGVRDLTSAESKPLTSAESKPVNVTPQASMVDKSNKKKRRRKEKGEQKPLAYKCNTCSKCFDTRNALFLHINATGHATKNT